MSLTINFKYCHSETYIAIAMMMWVNKMAHSYVNPTIHSNFLKKKCSHTCTNPLFFFFLKLDWYPHETPGKSKCLLLTLSWDEQDWQHGALEKYNLSVASNWNDLTGSEWACFCHKKGLKWKVDVPRMSCQKAKRFSLCMSQKLAYSYGLFLFCSVLILPCCLYWRGRDAGGGRRENQYVLMQTQPDSSIIQQPAKNTSVDSRLMFKE